MTDCTSLVISGEIQICVSVSHESKSNLWKGFFIFEDVVSFLIESGLQFGTRNILDLSTMDYQVEEGLNISVRSRRAIHSTAECNFLWQEESPWGPCF
jgi:hypothetical protein